MDWIGQHGEESSERIWRAYVGGVAGASLADLPGLLASSLKEHRPDTRTAIRRFRLNQKAVAILAGVTPSAVSQWTGKEGYPQPVPHSGRQRLYRLGDVLEHLGRDVTTLASRVTQLPKDVREALLDLIPPRPSESMHDVRARGRGEWRDGFQIRSS